MDEETFTGLRPVNKRHINQDLGSQTRRIVLPSSTNNGAVSLPTVEPAAAASVPKIVAKKKITLVPGVPALLEALPHGIPVNRGWLFIGSNPSMELTAFSAVVLHMDGISKCHSAVTEHNLKAFVTDMGSTNGTRITRKQETIEVGTEPVELHAEDVLWMGPAFFHVVQS